MENFADRIRRSPRAFGLLLFLFAIFLLSGFFSLSFSERARWVPLGTAVAGTLLCVWAMVRTFGQTTNQSIEAGRSVEEQQMAPHGLRNLTLTLTVGLAVGAIAGLVYSVPVIFFLFALLSQGKSGLRSAATIAILATAVVYLLFGLGLQIPLTFSVF